MSKFESPDPGYWCRHGYAVANVDPRGVGHSEGDFMQFGTQEGKDGYDFISGQRSRPGAMVTSPLLVTPASR